MTLFEGSVIFAGLLLVFLFIDLGVEEEEEEEEEEAEYPDRVPVWQHSLLGVSVLSLHLLVLCWLS